MTRTLRSLLAQEASLDSAERAQLKRALRFAWCNPSIAREAALPHGWSLVVAVRDDDFLLGGFEFGPPGSSWRPLLDPKAREAIEHGVVAATMGLDLLRSLLPEGPSLQPVYSSGRATPTLEGRSCGLSAGLATWSMLTGTPLPSDLAASAEVRWSSEHKGVTSPVGKLERKARVLHENSPAVRRLLIAKGHPEISPGALTQSLYESTLEAMRNEWEIEPIPVGSLEEAAAIAMPGAPSRFRFAREEYGRRWQVGHADVRSGARAALATLLDDEPMRALDIAAQVRRVLGPVSGHGTADRYATEFELLLVEGSVVSAINPYTRLRSLAPDHSCVRGGQFEILNHLVMEVFKRHPDAISNWHNLPQYEPQVIDTSGVELAVELQELVERLAENNHDQWSTMRLKQGWSFGPRNDKDKTNPCLVPYDQLSEEEKEYDRVMARESLKVIVSRGYEILPPKQG